MSGTVTRRFLYDGDELVAEYGGSWALLRRWVHGARVDDPVLWYEGAGTTAAERRGLLADHQGSIVGVVDGTGAATAINAYDAWGIPNDENVGRFGYTGQIWIPEIGMWHYKARIYSPTLGRFMQTDPVGYEDQMNLYTYVGNDPINLADPTGRSQTCNAQGLCTIIADGFDASRSNGQTTTLNPAQADQAISDIGNFRTNGQDETIGLASVPLGVKPVLRL